MQGCLAVSCCFVHSTLDAMALLTSVGTGLGV
jgi:hypothetical protein